MLKPGDTVEVIKNDSCNGRRFELNRMVGAPPRTGKRPPARDNHARSSGNTPAHGEETHRSLIVARSSGEHPRVRGGDGFKVAATL